MIKPKVVFDTNIYLSTIIFGGKPKKVLQLALQEKIILITSPQILLEVALKLKEKFLWKDEQVVLAIKAINKIAFVIRPKKRIKVIQQDPTDDKIIEAAITAKANYIITGDKHLLDIKQYQKIKILKPSEFLNVL